MGPQQAHREEVAMRGRLYFEFLCRWILRSEGPNRVIRTIHTWGSYEIFLLGLDTLLVFAMLVQLGWRAAEIDLKNKSTLLACQMKINYS